MYLHNKHVKHFLVNLLDNCLKDISKKPHFSQYQIIKLGLKELNSLLRSLSSNRTELGILTERSIPCS